MDPVLALFIVWLLVVVAVAVAGPAQLRRAGFRSTAPLPDKPYAHRFGPSATKVRGGCRIRWWTTTWPLGTLTFDDEYALVEMWNPFEDQAVYVEREHVRRVQRIPLPAAGIRFVTDDGSYDAVVFLTLSTRSLLERMAGRGWPVADG
jgi:hypothetical protein